MKRLFPVALLWLSVPSLGLLGACRGTIVAGKSLCNADPCNCKKTCDQAIDELLRDGFRNRLVPVAYPTQSGKDPNGSSIGDVIGAGGGAGGAGGSGDAAKPGELCRRLFVDIVGRLPNAQDYTTHCQGKALPDIMNDLFTMTTSTQAGALPDYVVARQRMWADRFGYNDLRGWYKNILDLDVLVGQLYFGQVSFATFIDLAAVHPGLLTAADTTEAFRVKTAVNPSIDPATLKKVTADAMLDTVFRALVLRAPTTDERELSNLYRIYGIDPLGADPQIPGLKARRLQIEACNCVGSKSLSCTITQITTVAGKSDTVSLPLRFGAVAVCTDEPKNTFYFEDALDDERAILAKPGPILRARPDFYSNYVKEALQRLLGYDVIAVLGADLGQKIIDLLTKNFQTDGSLQNLEATIFQSVLYRQAQIPPSASPAKDADGTDSLEFAGPRKRLPSAQYLASIKAVTGHDFGPCDTRISGQVYAQTVMGVTTQNIAPPSPPLLYPLKPGVMPPQVDYTGRDNAQLIGACPDHLSSLTIPDAGPFTQIGLDMLTRAACEDTTTTAMLPAGYANGTAQADLEGVLKFQYQQFFLDVPSSTELAAGVKGGTDCLKLGDQCKPELVARRLCSALLKSGRFATY